MWYSGVWHSAGIPKNYRSNSLALQNETAISLKNDLKIIIESVNDPTPFLQSPLPYLTVPPPY